MFNIDARPTFTVPVEVLGPTDDAPDGQSITVTFRAYPESELEGFAAFTREGQSGLLRKVVVNVDGVIDDDNKPVPFSDALMDKLLDWGGARVKIIQAYSKGLLTAKMGN